jgi:predicted DNA-binding transcriptional regulator YafY
MAPEERPQNPLSIIIQAMRERKMLSIVYTDRKGERTQRAVEPYEIKAGALFAFDPAKGSIRQFKLPNIADPRMLEASFEPRWPVRDMAEA